MGLLSFFSGATPEDIEKKGDKFFSSQTFGPAKIEYEKAQVRHKKKAARDHDFAGRITEKITNASEALALKHKTKGEELVEANCFNDAKELFFLALELTKKGELKAEIETLMKQTAEKNDFSEELPQSDSDKSSLDGEPLLDDSETFAALCNALSREEQKAYYGYGEAFIKGFIELNNGEFESAAESLSIALDENSSNKNFIPLELATCYLNMAEYEKARVLLESFLNDFPESLKGYQLLCDLLWILKEFDSVDQLLLSSCDEISDSAFINRLKGENLFQAEKFKEAESFYLDFINAKERDESILNSLAKTYDAAGETDKAVELYKELINTSLACGYRPSFSLRRRFADASSKAGVCTSELLDLYFGLLKEDPYNSSHYFSRISTIYSSLGNKDEAEKFKELAENS